MVEFMMQAQYFSEHPRGVNPVQLNDVVFSLHATAACIVTGLQCFIYEVGLAFLASIDGAYSDRKISECKLCVWVEYDGRFILFSCWIVSVEITVIDQFVSFNYDYNAIGCGWGTSSV